MVRTRDDASTDGEGVRGHRWRADEAELCAQLSSRVATPALHAAFKLDSEWSLRREQAELCAELTSRVATPAVQWRIK